MSLEHIKQLVYTKYDEIYNTEIIYYELEIEIEKLEKIVKPFLE